MNDASGFTGFENTGVDAAMDPRDRIFLSNHIRDFKIGAYPDEFGVTQRVRFDVMLDVRRFEITDDDEVASIVSYDLIVESIDALIDGPRIKLVETLAERLAALVLPIVEIVEKQTTNAARFVAVFDEKVVIAPLFIASIDVLAERRTGI